jgi:hypothetical protein
MATKTFFGVPVETEAWERAAIGTPVVTNGQGVGLYTSKDVGRALTFGTAQNFIEAVSAPIEGFFAAISPETVNDGYTLGSLSPQQQV